MPAPTASDLTSDTSGLEIKSILLLDDDTDLADALKGLLESRNFVVTTVGNGVDGLREVMALDFDAIICDMMMPHMPGDMFYLAVNKVKPQLARRFIFITGERGNEKVDKFLSSINAFVLFKPVAMEELIRAITLVMSRVPRE